MSGDRLITVTDDDRSFVSTMHRLISPFIKNRNKVEGWRVAYHRCIFYLMKIIRSFSDQRIVRLSYLSPLFRKVCELPQFRKHWKKRLGQQNAKPQYRLSMFKVWVGAVYANAHRLKKRKHKISKKNRAILSTYLERGVKFDSFYAFTNLMMEELEKLQVAETNAVVNVGDFIRRNKKQIDLHGAPACFLLAQVYIKLGNNYLIGSFKDADNPVLQGASQQCYQFALQYFYQAWILEAHSSAAIHNAFVGKTIFEAFNEFSVKDVFHSWKQTCKDFIRLHIEDNLDVLQAKNDAAKAVSATVLELKEAKASL